MISGFKVSNFRSFQKETSVEIRPLTLFFGFNNSGKSALLRALPLIGDSLCSNARSPIALDSEAAGGGIYRDLTGDVAFGAGRTIKFNVCITIEGLEYSVSWHVNDIPERRIQVIGNVTIFSDNRCIWKATWKPELTDSGVSYEYEIEQEGVAVQTLELKFRGLVPEKVPTISTDARIVFENLRELGGNVMWMHAVRKTPPRGIKPRGTSPTFPGTHGEETLEILSADAILSSWGKLGNFVSNWYEAIGRNLVPSWEGDLFALKSFPISGNGSSATLFPDSGEGLIQVLPVLVSLALASRGEGDDPNIICIEEPESHLHPKLHSHLAEAMCEIAKAGRSKLLIETHSENILLRVQRAIADGMNPDLVLVYWVRQDSDGRSWIEPVTFDAGGRPSENWPAMVFSEDIRQAGLLLKSQEERFGKDAAQ
ncbi:MAG: hypothetical protein EOP09_00750 [Proteobacteria bacterium]|nr:MAG: hypothetical protein EOP09_00750 [Pseudomonadota bacterium]